AHRPAQPGDRVNRFSPLVPGAEKGEKRRDARRRCANDRPARTRRADGRPGDVGPGTGTGRTPIRVTRPRATGSPVALRGAGSGLPQEVSTQAAGRRSFTFSLADA